MTNLHSSPAESDRATGLLFVYNADGTLVGKLSDAAHKALSPGTYQCDLCRVTYGLARMKRRWRAFVETLPLPTTFAHRDGFRRDHESLADVELPAVFVRRSTGALDLLIAATELRAVQSLDDLEGLVSARLKDRSA